MTVGQLLLVAAGCLVAGAIVGRRAAVVWLTLTIVAAGLSLSAAGLALYAGETLDWRSTWTLGGETVHLRLDAVSAFFLALAGFVGGAAALYTRGYWADRDHPRSAGRNRVWWSALLLSMGLVVLCSNGLHFLIAWELFAICSYFLITVERRNREVRAAGWVYLAASHAGTLCLFAFFALLAASTGGWDLGPMRDRPELAPLFWLVLAGFGVKAGLFPLHIWLPSAHANAPSHVSAILSGVALKMGIYGIVRFSGWLPVPVAAGWAVMSIGAVTAVFGIAFALAQNDLKRLLAYSSVENIGIILVGVGGGLFGVTHGDPRWARLALAGGLLHIWNHGLFKSLLFFGAGSVLHATGTKEMSRLGGLWRSMPWTAALFSVGAVAVCALPPLNGFVGEWLIYRGLFEAAIAHGGGAWIAMIAVIVLGITGALALATFVKAGATVFCGASRTPLARHAHEAPLSMRIPMLTGAAACLGIGLVPMLAWPAVEQVVAAWYPARARDASAAPLAILGPVQVAVGAVLVLGCGVLWLVAHRRGVRRAPTWDCGYALPTARMQYTSGSFAGIPGGWFAWALRPERQVRRPRGVFPPEALRMERIPEAVLERVIAPVGAVILRVSSFVRRLQHGRLQYYIAYVVVGLLGLTALVATGVKP